MEDFDLQYYPDILQVQEKILSCLATGPVPVHLVDGSILEARYQQMWDSLAAYRGRHIIAYPFKANYQIAGLGVFNSLGAWAEVVSGHEYRMARDLGYSGNRIIFNGPYKTNDDLRIALREGCLVNVNDHDELTRLVDITQTGKTEYKVGIRLSARLTQFGHSRFGFSIENGEADSAVQRLAEAKNLCLTACHTHIHGDADDPDIYRESARKFCRYIRERIPNYANTIESLNLGGGFPAHAPKPKSREHWNPRQIDTYVDALVEEVESCFPADYCPDLILEPGRYLVVDSTMFVSKVVSRREVGGQQLLTSNGTISMVPMTHYSPQIIRAYSPQLVLREGEAIPTTLYGASCRENDILYQGDYPAVENGDWLIHYAAGGYNANFTPEFIFEKPPARLLDND